MSISLMDLKKNKKVTTYLKSSNIRLVVFDLHGTLTNRTSVHPYHIEYRDKYIEKKLERPFPKDFSGGTDEAFALFPELDKYDFYKHRDNDPSFDFERIHVPNPELADKLKIVNKSFHTILYTDSYLKQIERTLLAMGLDGIFDSVIGMENGHRKSSSQFTIYPELCKKLNIEMDNVLIVGDRMDKDINPVLQAGGNGIQVESNAYIQEALEILINSFSNMH